MVSKKRLFKFPRYWYHLSTTLKQNEVELIPRDDSTNRSFGEPNGKRICVAPTIEQCLTALVYGYHQTYHIYRTKKRMIPRRPPIGTIFDYSITNEGWIEIPTAFIKIGTMDFDAITSQDIDIISESASSDNITYCKEVLQWWRKFNLKKYIKRT